MSVKVSILVLTTAFLLPSPLWCGQEASRSREGYWKAQLHIVSFGFGEVTERNYESNRTRVFQNVDVQQYKYNIFQNPRGIVREELSFISRNRSVEPPLENRLYDYDRGFQLAFDKGREDAVRWIHKPPMSQTPLQSRRILGHLCRGTQYEWRDRGRTFRHQRWFVEDVDFRTPLLEIRYVFDATDSLLDMEVRVVSEMEVVPHLPASMFEAPAGLKIVEIPSIE